MVVLSERYITDRYLPDKAIDIMDEASSYMAMHSPLINEINTLSRELTRLNEQKSAIEFQENKTEEDYRRLAEVTTKIAQKSGRFDGLSAERDELWLDEASVAKVIENWTGIPATSISENEYQKMQSLESALKKRIIGQDEAIGKIARAIRRSRAGVAYKKKPVSFIFAGSTGVGKTELVKVLAAYLFDSPESLIRLDMSSLWKSTRSRESSARLRATSATTTPDSSPKKDSPQSPIRSCSLTKSRRRTPTCSTSSLQILDDGRITDAHGKTVNFENTVLIMTTNAGSSADGTPAGFTMTAHSADEVKVKAALEDFLRPLNSSTASTTSSCSTASRAKTSASSAASCSTTSRPCWPKRTSPSPTTTRPWRCWSTRAIPKNTARVTCAGSSRPTWRTRSPPSSSRAIRTRSRPSRSPPKTARSSSRAISARWHAAF